jgi:hypothetical protein
LKYEKEAKENPYWFAAYQKTQPQTKFDYSEEPEKEVVKPKTTGVSGNSKVRKVSSYFAISDI